MRQLINGYAIFNNNCMTRQLDKRPVLLVESDADLSIVGPHLRDENVRCAPGFSKSATLQAAGMHSDQGDDWVIALVDRDLDSVPAAPNVLATKHYDLEAEIFFAVPDRTRQYVYSQIVSESVGHADAKSFAQTALMRAESIATAIGVLRQHVHVGQLPIKMRSMPIGEVIRRASGDDYVSPASELACQRASQPALHAGLKAAGHAEIQRGIALDHLCAGHDLFGALSTLIGRKSGRQVNARDFARGLHATVDCISFRRLSIYTPLEKWLQALTGYEMWDCAA